MPHVATCVFGHHWEDANASGSQSCPVCAAFLSSLAYDDDSTVDIEAGDELPPPPATYAAAQEPTFESRSAVEAVAPPIPGYELLGQLGRGGMGVVYQARHLRLNRLVALKVLLGGGHTDDAERERFRREAEAVASLQHPNIVQIFEVGEYGGLPYLALELVDGGTLSGKLAGAPLHPRPAAELLETLARAVHHAHRRGVIHRDLKPANVLLSADSAVPKVTDFGLAKRLDNPAGATQSGTIAGTPSYMAPEQAAGQSDRIGPATDVYALGAVLYECLVGRPPFMTASVFETIGQVMKDEPIAPRQLQPGVPRDLETICLKCLHKEPGRRYLSAEALSDDLRNFLDGRPITARRTPLWERTAKWARRRPTAAALIAFALVVGVAATVFTIRYLEDLHKHNLELTAANDKVTAESHKVLAESQKVTAALAGTEKERSRAEGNLGAAVEAIERMLKRVAVHRLGRMPMMERQQIELLEDALGLFDRLLASQEGDPRLRLMQAHTLQQTAVILQNLGRYPEAVARIERGLALLDQLRLEESGPVPNSTRMRLESWFHSCRSLIYFRGNDLAKARGEIETTLALQEQLRAAAPDDREYRGDVAASQCDLAALYLAEGALDKAELHLVRAREATDRLTREVPREAHYLSLHANILNNLGALFIDQADLVRAAALQEEAIDAFRGLRRADPSETGYSIGLARALSQRGIALFGQGYLKQADVCFRESYTLRERLVRDHPAARPLTADLAWSLVHFGRVHAEREEFGLAKEKFDDAIALIEKVDAKDATFRDALREAYTARAELASRRERYEDAERDFGRAVALARGPQQRELRILHAIMLALTGAPAKAVEEVEAALDGPGLPPGQIFDAARALALAAEKESDPKRSEQAGARAVRLLAGLVPTGYFRSAERQALLDKHPALASLRKRADFKEFRDNLNK